MVTLKSMGSLVCGVRKKWKYDAFLIIFFKESTSSSKLENNVKRFKNGETKQIDWLNAGHNIAKTKKNVVPTTIQPGSPFCYEHIKPKL